MKKYRIPYAAYPFNMDDVVAFGPDWEEVEANSLDEALVNVREKYKDSIEIFESSARKHYNE
jgi:hypothetical protein